MNQTGALTRSLKIVVAKSAILALLVAFAVLFLVPLAWVFLYSFKSLAEIYTHPGSWIPLNWTFENYPQALHYIPLARYLLNSTFVAGSITLSNLLLASLAGYSLSKFRYRGRELLFIIILAVMIVPRNVVAIPTFLVIKSLGLVNTYLGVMSPFFSAPIAIFIMRQNMRSIPDSLIEAARIDGAGEFRIFFSIVLPLSKAALVAMGLVMYIFAWNDFFWPLIVLGDPAKYTMPLGLSLITDMLAQDFHLIFAATVMAIAPTIIVYIFLQRHFIKGFTMSGIKM